MYIMVGDMDLRFGALKLQIIGKFSTNSRHLTNISRTLETDQSIQVSEMLEGLQRRDRQTEREREREKQKKIQCGCAPLCCKNLCCELGMCTTAA